MAKQKRWRGLWVVCVLWVGCGSDDAIEGPKLVGSDVASDGATQDAAANDATQADGVAQDGSTDDGTAEDGALLDGVDSGGDGSTSDGSTSDGGGDGSGGDGSGGDGSGTTAKACSACAEDGDCGANARCVELVDGKHCLPACDNDDLCETIGAFPGYFACSDPDGMGKVCAPTPGPEPLDWAKGACGCPGKPASVEACNGVDDDCDGDIDEGFCSDDGNPCTASACDVKTGTCKTTQISGPCEDGDACTTGEACKNGVCGSGKLLTCPDDGNPCTAEGCDKASGCASAPADGKTCVVDGGTCQEGVCEGGTCSAGAAGSCDDGNPCTADSCDKASGTCKHAASGNGNACSDDSACTENDACNSGKCVGKALDCQDGNPCTKDSCDPIAGCSHSDSDGVGCDDGDKCSAKDTCQGGACQAGTAVDCGAKGACAQQVCEPTTGGCVATGVAVGAPCDDGDPCSDGDGCAGGVCKGTPLAGVGGKGCDDNNVCTVDSCAIDADGKGGCSHSPVVVAGDGGNGGSAVPCDDGDACTEGDGCVQGLCKGKPLIDSNSNGCDDGNPCTKDSCDLAKGCTHTDADGTPCDDGNPCSKGDACKGGGCAAGEKICDCTINADCVGKGSDLCLGALVCAAGACAIELANAVTCADDGNPCTVAACDSKTGSCATSKLADGKPCDADGTVCTANDSCVAGACKAGNALACDDGDACTKDSCDTAAGCVYAAVLGDACDDGDACTTGETCAQSGCVGGNTKGCAAKACHTVACEAKTGACVYAPIYGCGGLCAVDGDCAQDGNPCTAATCDKAAGKCATAPLKDGSACDDGKFCTIGEACTKGACTGSQPKGCDDGNVCTWDVCTEAAKGCTTLVKGGGCSDGDGCTVGDTCSAGVCKAGAPKACNDWNPCTADSCDSKTGQCVFAPIAGCAKSCAADADCPKPSVACEVVYCATDKTCKSKPEPNNATCDDGSACTALDLCLGGKCAGLNAKNCDDADPCTVDSCDAKAGSCGHVAGVGPCQDGDLCTSNDACKDGKCASGTTKVCNDGNSCTVDSCNAKTGACVFAPTPGCGGFCTEAKHCGDDGNPCTVEACGAGGKCSSTKKADNTLCDDNDACSSVSFCKGGLCTGANKKTCVDNDVCTADSCSKTTGDCVFTDLSVGACSDGSYCTSSDACKDGKCVGKAKVCDDKNACTADSCNPKTGGCVYTPIAGCGPYCGKDGDCKDDGNPCTVETCTLATKLCAKTFAPAITSCSDNNPCTVNDTCKYANGVCYGGGPKDCNDDNACTSDVCDPKTGTCNHVNNANACSDGDACTLGDKCSGGSCKAGAAKVCNDAKACTVDSCDAKTGACVYTPSKDAGCCAVDGDCKDDGNACTDAYCDTVTKGCKQKSGNEGGACNDGNGCTSGETCKAGTCGNGTKKDCDDKEVCTDDLCDPDSGKCFAVFNTKACDDGNKCTSTSICKDGTCPGGKPIVSCLAKPCNTVSCDAKTGQCVYTPVPDCK